MAGEGASELLFTASRLRSGTAGLRQDKVVSNKQIESSVCPLIWELEHLDIMDIYIDISISIYIYYAYLDICISIY